MSRSTAAEHLDVLVVGAGLSGVCAGHYLQADCPWASWAIFEGRDAIGGTWDLFRYPGVRSDSDMFTLGFPCRPWDNDRMIADGASIRQYIADTAAEEGIDRHIRFQHRVTRAEWSTDDACWHVTAEQTDTGERVELTCGFLFSCGGYYRYDRGYLPEFTGTDRFTGTLVHPQFWPEDLDYAGKRVVVIGSGATAVTLVPALAATAAHVTMLQRSPTYIASVPATIELQFVGGIELVVDGEPVELAARLSYKGMMLEGVPNLAIAVGYTNASWTLKSDLTCRYVCRLLNQLRNTGRRQCTPVNRDPSVVAEPLLGLQSGYIQRAADRLPKQGSKFPWRVYQSFLADDRATKLQDVEDGVMQFTDPVPEPVAAAS